MKRTAPLLAAGLLSLALGGCSTPADPIEGGRTSAIFPHDEAWAETSDHGARYVQSDPQRCASCHALESDDEARPPGCRSCHADYPHPPDWHDGALHGQRWLAMDPAGCEACHGADLEGGLSAPSCRSCHAAWPHPTGWEEGATHAAWILQRGTVDACVACHSVETTEPESPATSCRGCHEIFPHDEGWGDPTQHGLAWLAGDCGGCHGEASDGGVMAPSCHSCHGAYPHPADWAQGHIPVVDAAGDAGCTSCHEPGDAPAEMQAACGRACHGVEP